MATISNYTEDIRVTNKTKGLQTTALVLDTNGVPTAYNSTPNTSQVYSDSIINTSFKPNIGQYSIEETVAGELQDFGSDVFNGVTVDSGEILSTPIADGYKFVDTGASSSAPDQHWYGFDCTDIPAGETVLITFTADIISGSLTLTHYFNGTAYVPNPYGSLVVTNGQNQWLVPSRNVTTVRFPCATNVAVASEIDMTFISIKELTTKTQRTEQRLLTHTDAHLGVDEYGGSFSASAGGITLTPLGGGDYNVITDPASRLILNTLTASGSTVIWEFNVTINSGVCTIVKYYDGLDWITLDTPHVVTNGLNRITLGTRSDEATLYMETNLIEYDIDFRDNTIKEVLTQNKYYIDGVEQDVTPPLPDPAVTINLNDTAAIGYPDTIQSRAADFKVHSEVIAPAYGPDLYEGHGSFDTAADYGEFTTSGYGWSHDDGLGIVIRVDTTALESHFYRGVNLIDGGTYEIKCDSNFASGSAQFWTAAGTTSHDIGTPYTFVSDTTFLNIGITTTDGDFNFDNLVIRQVLEP